MSDNTLPDALLPGRSTPLGAHVIDTGLHASGVNFAVFSQRAKLIELCVYDASGEHELKRYAMHGPDDGVFHGFLPDAKPGLIYGYRAHGSYKPESGYRFNPHKLLLDPYAREIAGEFRWRPEHFGYTLGHPEGGRVLDTRDNGTFALKARVTAPEPSDLRHPTRSATHPRQAIDTLVLYELHVKGFTMQLPGIPDPLRGTYAGLAHPASIAHLKRLGVTTLSLLPVQTAIDEQGLLDRGLRNYWGYNTIGFFCPEPRLASRREIEGATEEFRAMVATLQAHGFEVVLDIVFNHTPEGDEHGPTLSFRGLDNASWYRLMPDDRSRYENSSGCGNTVRAIHPRVTQFVLDVLRYWVETMGVDGFRFDLAPALGRTRQGYDPSAPFFVALRQDPALANVHLIAEPWDCGHDGYQLGRLPGRFLEWNDRFRDVVRGYWLGNDAVGAGVGRSEFARRFTGSSDLFHHGHRLPTASVNFITAHDGRTLTDVVTYRDKHNTANGEHNRDGHSHEVCANFGIEGTSDHPAVIETRRRVRRALLATTLLAQGTPMLCAGDEFGNSQQGNNNAYCQDNPIGWLDWNDADRAYDDIDFIASLIALRRDFPLLRYARWFASAPSEHEPAMHWFTPSGCEMQIADWHDHHAHAFSCQIAADTASPPQWCIVFNPGAHPARFHLPHGPWQVAIDSSATLDAQTIMIDDAIDAPFRALLVLRHARHFQEMSS